MKPLLLLAGIALLLGVLTGFYRTGPTSVSPLSALIVAPTATPSPTPTPTPQLIPSSHLLKNNYHIFQTFNNCGPAALSMALSYYDISISQQELGQALRPYQVPGGDNDDKSVTLEEIAAKAKDYGLHSYHRPAGNINMIKLFIAHGMPVITRTWLKVNDDIGHYRIVKGYIDTSQTIIQDDSLQGANLSYSYDEFLELWKKFNYEYVVLVRPENKPLADSILAEHLDPLTAWREAVTISRDQLREYPEDIYARFNLSVALYHTGDYRASVAEFEKVESRLPFRTLWYQIEPILSYMALRDYDRVMTITERILNYHNRAFSELYIIRGNIYKTRGNAEAARIEYQLAVRYNRSLKKAQEALNLLSQ